MIKFRGFMRKSGFCITLGTLLNITLFRFTISLSAVCLLFVSNVCFLVIAFFLLELFDLFEKIGLTKYYSIFQEQEVTISTS